jgi:hypothetical protein
VVSHHRGHHVADRRPAAPRVPPEHALLGHVIHFGKTGFDIGPRPDEDLESPIGGVIAVDADDGVLALRRLAGRGQDVVLVKGEAGGESLGDLDAVLPLPPLAVLLKRRTPPDLSTAAPAEGCTTGA